MRGSRCVITGAPLGSGFFHLMKLGVRDFLVFFPGANQTHLFRKLQQWRRQVRGFRAQCAYDARSSENCFGVWARCMCGACACQTATRYVAIAADGRRVSREERMASPRR